MTATSEYRARLEARSRDAARWRRLDVALSNTRLAVFVAGIVQGFATFGTHHFAPLWLAPTALVFLGLNDQRLEAKADSLYELVDGVAVGRIDKSAVAVFLRDHCWIR